ncbi:pre-60S shuttling factor Alb1 [Schizosaccharomyces osmophilus]|uniref:Pre-60S shuttling factor Alb1 n=1 Tax=Schizosaccharomyces osmophilus TaxID=2545709 RepID=A0AAE9W9Q8_9SCHI|nr:pre-60S shuttling factor Alb1 [Schizosaccharomyces osmophilus]WBW71391.1 pre-60S shuttling factor Alb1 [Schizosaccharomyces osmophilus]
MPYRNDRKKSAKRNPDSIIHGRVPSKKTIKKHLRNGKYSLQRLAEQGIHLDDAMMEIEAVSDNKERKNKNKLFGNSEEEQQDNFMSVDQPAGKGTILGVPPSF